MAEIIQNEPEMINVMFEKNNDKITLYSINEDVYASNEALITIDDNGIYNKIDNVDLNEIISSKFTSPDKVEQTNQDYGFDENLEQLNADEENERKQAELDQAFKQGEEEDENERKQAELDQAFKQAEEEDEKKRQQAEEEKKKKEQPINEPEKKEIKKPISLIDELKNNKLFKQRQEVIQGGKKNRTKKSIKAGKKKSKKVRFVMTKKGRKNKKNRTRR